MKKQTLIAAILMLAAALADAQSCGFPPFPPFGTEPMCVCDRNGNCHWIFVVKPK